MNCSSDCDRGNCPFVSDPQRSTRYVCLKCGLERDINSGLQIDPIILLILIASLFIALLVNHSSPAPEPDPAPTELPTQ